MTYGSCYICNTGAEIKKETREKTYVVSSKGVVRFLCNNYIIQCERCGTYGIRHNNPESLIGELNNQQMANLSWWLRHYAFAIIDADKIDDLKNLRTPTVGEKAERLMLYFSKLHTKAGKLITIRTDRPSMQAQIGCFDREELDYIFKNYLVDTKSFISDLHITPKGECSFKISPDGWAYVESLKDINPESQIGFVAMWFDKSLLEVYEQGIKKGIEDAGFEPLKMDELQHINRIDDEIIANIRGSRFVVADFTGQNAGVYFESGYALGLGLKVIWLCKEDELGNVHFDTRQYRTIKWKVDELDELRKELRYCIEANIV